MMRVLAQSERPAPLVWPLYLVATLLISLVFSAITPPFQAPDEFDHVKRAYMLGQGQILLKSVEGSPSGGYLDTGLVAYMDHFTPLKGVGHRKVSADELQAAAAERWTGEQTFQTAVGTAYYFPLMYTPQAVGLGLGKALEMSVSKSYRLARLLELLTCGALLGLAFCLHRPSAAVLALLALPMNLFLFGSAVLDPMATAVALVSLSAFMRVLFDGQSVRPLAVACLHVGVLLLCACRANMLPMLLLPFIAAWIQRERRQWYIAVAVAAFVLGWTLLTVKTTVYPPSGRQIDHGARLLHLLTHPGELWGILWATWTNSARMSFYVVSFVGVLGWLDAPFPMSFYYVVVCALGAIMLLSLTIDDWRSSTQIVARLALVTVALGSILMTFLALLVQWTDPSSPTVDGVQGRYLLIPLLCLVFALTATSRPRRGPQFYIGHGLSALLLCAMAYASAGLLVQRYHTVATQEASMQIELKPSAPLTASESVELHFPTSQRDAPLPLDRIAIRFGTYMTEHVGTAELQLWTADGQRKEVPFALATLVDNGYAEFPLDGRPYVGGKVVSRDGGGVSVWESHAANKVDSCILVQPTGEEPRLVLGCPLP